MVLSGRAAVVAGVVAVVVGLAGTAWLADAPPGSSGFRAWLIEVADPADDDRGWNRLERWLQDHAYGGDRAAYLAEVRSADWRRMRLGPVADVWSDDGFVAVEAPLLSPPDSVPAFVFDRQIVHGLCEGRRPVGIGAFEDRRPFAGHRFAGGGLTGGQARCNAEFGAG